MFRRLPVDEQRAAAAAFIELVRQWESSDDLILRTYSLVGLRADVDFMLWRIAFDPLCFQAMEAAIRRSRLGAYLSQVHSFLSLQRRSQYVNRIKGAGERRRAAGRARGSTCSSTPSRRRGRGTGCRRTRGRA